MDDLLPKDRQPLDVVQGIPGFSQVEREGFIRQQTVPLVFAEHSPQQGQVFNVLFHSDCAFEASPGRHRYGAAQDAWIAGSVTNLQRFAALLTFQYSRDRIHVCAISHTPR